MFGEAFVVGSPNPESNTITVRPWFDSDVSGAAARTMEIQIGGLNPTSPVVDVSIDGVEKAIQVSSVDNGENPVFYYSLSPICSHAYFYKCITTLFTLS